MRRWCGWALLAGVVLSWVALTIWVATDPCTFDCGDFGRGRGAIALWILSLAAVPPGAWLLGKSYEVDRETPPHSVTAALGAKLLYLFSFAMFLIMMYAAFHLIKNLNSLVTGCCSNGPSLESMQSSWRAGAVFSAFGLAWFGLIAFNTVAAARAMDRAVEGGPPILLWLTAAAMSVAALAGVLISQLMFSPSNQSLGGQEIGEEGGESAANPIPTHPTPGPVIGFLPAKASDKGSGYEISNVRIEIRASNYPELGNRYTVFLDGHWAGAGKPKEQLCSYLFLSTEERPVLMHDATFSFAEGGGNLDRHEAMTLFESHMDGPPSRAEISCKDRDDAQS